MKPMILFTAIFAAFVASGQRPGKLIDNGNSSYRAKNYTKADQEYNRALSKQPGSTIALFNSGNARFRLKQYSEAADMFEAAAATATDPLTKSLAYNNLGLSLVRRQQTAAAVEAFKKSLRLNPNDTEARENLQKALKELQMQQHQRNEQQKDKSQKKPKDKQKPQPQHGRLSKDEAEKMFDELRREEKNLQKEVQRKTQSARQLKDW
ncbi:MAG TPA: tetratricopeptide repeat protein [Chitinophagaceae bacterium]